jgi:hypothetical protein
MLRVRPVAEGELLIDGGLYVIDWANEAEVQTYRDEIRAPRTEQILISKFLKFSGGEWWCMCRDSFARLNGTVVAMVVGVVSTAAGTPEPIHAGQVGANAATDFGSASSASGSQTSVTYSGAPTTIDYTILTLSYTNNTGATQTLEMFASCRFTVSGSGGGWLAAPRVTGTYPQSAVVGRTAASDEGYAYTGSATIANGATATLTLSAEFKNGGTGSNALVFAYTDAALKYNILKR